MEKTIWGGNRGRWSGCSWQWSIALKSSWATEQGGEGALAKTSRREAIQSRAICHQIPVTINIFSLSRPWKSPPSLASPPRWNVLHCKINAAIGGATLRRATSPLRQRLLLLLSISSGKSHDYWKRVSDLSFRPFKTRGGTVSIPLIASLPSFLSPCFRSGFWYKIKWNGFLVRFQCFKGLFEIATVFNRVFLSFQSLISNMEWKRRFSISNNDRSIFDSIFQVIIRNWNRV